MPSFLISRLSSLGDVVCTLPVAATLKAAFPDAHITWVVDKRFAAIVECCPLVDEVVILQSRLPTYGRSFDVALDMQGLAKSALAIARAKATLKLGYHWQREGARLFSSPVTPDPTSFHVVDQYVDVARCAIQLLSGSPSPLCDAVPSPSPLCEAEGGGVGEGGSRTNEVGPRNPELGTGQALGESSGGPSPLCEAEGGGVGEGGSPAKKLGPRNSELGAREALGESSGGPSPLCEAEGGGVGEGGPRANELGPRNPELGTGSEGLGSDEEALGAGRSAFGEPDGLRASPTSEIRNPKSEIPNASDSPKSEIRNPKSEIENLFALSPPSASLQSLSPYVASTLLNPGAGWATKRWPATHFAELIRLLQAAGHRTVLIGGPDTEAAAAEIVALAPTESLVGKTNLKELIAVISMARAHVGGDTGSTHIAAAVGIRAIGLYSITNPRRSCPYGQIENCIYEPSGLSEIEPADVFRVVTL